MQAQPRLPLADLEVATRRPVMKRCGGTDALQQSWSSDRELAEWVGVSRDLIVRWRRNGIPLDSAERAALACDFHPVEVWGDTWLDVVLDPCYPEEP